MEKVKKAYYLLFYKLYLFFNSLSDDGWEKWKSLLVICVLDGFIIFNIDLWIEILYNKSFILDQPKSIIVVLCISITILNYYIFLHNDRWRKYEEEFKSYSKRKHQAINLIVFLFVTGVLGSLIFAFYQMSLIDWSKYR